MTFDRDLEEAMKRMRKEREMEPFYLEHFGSDLTTTDSHDVYRLAAERARDRITPSQPSREVDRGPGIAAAEAYLASLFERKVSTCCKATLCMVVGWVALLLVIWLLGSLVELLS